MDATKNLHKQQTIGQRLRILRESVGQSMEAFGLEIGFDKSYLSRLERGEAESPSTRFVDAVCSKYPVSRDWLMEGIGDPIPTGVVENATQNAVDWTKISSHMSLAAKTMESLQGELSTVEVLRIIMRGLPVNERVKKTLEVMQDPSVRTLAKPLWLKAMLRASIDPEVPPNSPALVGAGPDEGGRKPGKQK